MSDRTDSLIGVANALFAAALTLLLLAMLVAAARLPVFDFREVRVVGDVSRLTREQVALIVRREVRGNLFTADLEPVRTAFEKLPWVRTAEVRRTWPPGLTVSVEEQTALARWGDIGLVNTHGELFEAATDEDLPEFAGPAGASAEMAERYLEFSRLLQPLGTRIIQLTLSPRRAWEMRLDSGVLIALGRERMAPRLERFVSVHSASVGTLAGRVRYVDLRYPNGFAARVPPQSRNPQNKMRNAGDKGKA